MNQRAYDANEVIGIQELIRLLLQRGFRFDYMASYELLHYPKSHADSDGFLKNLKNRPYE